MKKKQQSNGKIYEKWLVFASFIITTCTLQAQQLAFPSAEGSGRYAAGGRGGDVYEVTNLNNSGSGSIVDAVSSGNRTIVFRLSGTIELGDVILSPKSNTTIAGQTAPGDGICIKGRIKIGSVSDVIIRYIRVRVDAGAANSNGDAIDISSGTNIIIDHVSASYARDEGISCQEESDKVTVQWCIISEGLSYENHSFGSLIRGDYGDEKCYHHNLYAHNKGRNPRPGNYTGITTDPEGLHFDFRNNVVYNWAGSKAGYNSDDTEVSRYNFVGNAYIKGPESGNLIFREASVNSYGYFKDNSLDGYNPPDPWTYVDLNMTSAEQEAYKVRSYEIPMDSVTTTSPEQAKKDVLALAGASYPIRDTIDKRIIQDVLNKTGHSIATIADQPEGAWPVLNTLPPPTDDDSDGMPNDWELAHALNPNDPEDRNTIGDGGYTQLELYLHSLAGEITTHIDEGFAALPGNVTLIQNYPNPFNSSTTITYKIATRSQVDLKVFDMMGKEVAVLVNGIRNAGAHSVSWDALNEPGGIYFYQLKVGPYLQTKRMILLKK